MLVQLIYLGRPGTPTSTALDMHIDDLAVSTTASDYPIGDGEIFSRLPIDCGTDNSNNLFRWFSDGGASSGAVAMGNIYSSLVDDWPAFSGANADWLEMQGNDPAAYVEFPFEAPLSPE